MITLCVLLPNTGLAITCTVEMTPSARATPERCLRRHRCSPTCNAQLSGCWCRCRRSLRAGVAGRRRRVGQPCGRSGRHHFAGLAGSGRVSGVHDGDSAAGTDEAEHRPPCDAPVGDYGEAQGAEHRVESGRQRCRPCLFELPEGQVGDVGFYQAGKPYRGCCQVSKKCAERIPQQPL